MEDSGTKGVRTRRTTAKTSPAATKAPAAPARKAAAPKKAPAVGGAAAPCNAAADLPKDQSPENGTARYSVTLTEATATAFTIQAAPAGSYADALCGTMTITQTGAKTETGAGSLGDCWKS